MGAIADMILDGVLCESCGEFIGRSVGYTQKCRVCSNSERRIARLDPKGNQAHKPYQCGWCSKRFRNEQGLNDHQRVVHGADRGKAVFVDTPLNATNGPVYYNNTTSSDRKGES